ncbi:MAG TPA: hypothetical protein VFN87_10420, partial [Solirubrobacteraceae bacterium]|nr:hypothetical protein [Solirubrobacteraceae bacterium]
MTAALRGAQRLGQLIPAVRPVELILGPVDVFGLAQDLADQLAVVAVLIHRRAGLDLRPIDRDHPDRYQPGLPAEREHVIKELADLSLVPATELRNGRVIRAAHPGDQLERDVLPARPLDRPRGTDPPRIRI